MDRLAKAGSSLAIVNGRMIRTAMTIMTGWMNGSSWRGSRDHIPVRFGPSLLRWMKTKIDENDYVDEEEREGEC